LRPQDWYINIDDPARYFALIEVDGGKLEATCEDMLVEEEARDDKNMVRNVVAETAIQLEVGGCRVVEVIHHMGEILFACPYPLGRRDMAASRMEGSSVIRSS
jgi:hypothetical protein